MLPACHQRIARTPNNNTSCSWNCPCPYRYGDLGSLGHPNSPPTISHLYPGIRAQNTPKKPPKNPRFTDRSRWRLQNRVVAQLVGFMDSLSESGETCVRNSLKMVIALVPDMPTFRDSFEKVSTSVDALVDMEGVPMDIKQLAMAARRRLNSNADSCRLDSKEYQEKKLQTGCVCSPRSYRLGACVGPVAQVSRTRCFMFLGFPPN